MTEKLPIIPHKVEMLSTVRGGESRERRDMGKKLTQAAIVQANLHETNRQLSHEVSHDDLTGLMNKKAWKVEVAERIKAKKPFGVIFFDMDKFKIVNDVIGHEKGDELLGMFGKHMRASFKRKGDAVSHEAYFRKSDDEELPLGRYGGDEFAILVDLSDRDRPDGLTQGERLEVAEDYTRQVINEFVDTLGMDVKEQNFGISQGSAAWDPEYPIADTQLISNADKDMYRSKVANGSAR